MVVLQRIQSFQIYKHLFFCDRGLYATSSLCTKVVVKEKHICDLFQKEVFIEKEIFSSFLSGIHMP